MNSSVHALRYFTWLVGALVLSLTTLLFAQLSSPPFRWASTVGQTNSSFCYDTATDTAGNVYVTGYFHNSLQMGTFIVTNTNYDMFVAKLSNRGEPIWIRQGLASSQAMANDVAVDRQGNVYVAGTFYDQLQFGTNSVNSEPYGDVFVVKYNSVGDVLWARAGGSDYYDDWPSIGADQTENCYLTVNLGGSAGRFGTNLLGDFPLVIAKFDPTGNLVWTKHPEGGSGYINGMAVDPQGNSYATGTFGRLGLVLGAFALTNSTTNGSYDFFIAKYDPEGNVIWAKRAGGTGAGYTTCCIQGTDTGLGVGLDADANCYVTGYFTAVTDFEGTKLVANPTNGNAQAMFIAKYTSAGQLAWVKHATGDSVGHSIVVGPDRKVYVTGNFSESEIAFGGTILTNRDFFVTKADEVTGNFIWAKDVNGPAGLEAYGISADARGAIYLTGQMPAGTFQFGTIAVSSTAAVGYAARLDPDRPLLDIDPSGEQTRVSWLTNWSGYLFESSSDLATWLPVTNSITAIGNENVSDHPPIDRNFFRLRKP